MNECYFDNAATTKVCPEAAEAALEAMTQTYGNPSSTHALGRNAKALLDKSRKTIASALGCTPAELYFTGCGSESNNWALSMGAKLMERKGKHIISSVTEHDAVRQPLLRLQNQGWEITFLEPDESGAVSPEQLRAALRPDTVLVSFMLVNNETGAVTDIPAMAKVLKETKSQALLHCDAVQGFLKVPFHAARSGCDMVSLSAHKVHAPKGIGALYVKSGVKLPPYLLGGGQENGMRSGTESLPLIAAFAAAVKAYEADKDAKARMLSLRQATMEKLSAAIPGVVFLGGGAPHILSLSLPGYRSEVLMNCLEADGVYVSKSSACKRGKRSHVLEAMGISDKVIDGTIRVSFSRFTTAEDVDALCGALTRAAARLAHVK